MLRILKLPSVISNVNVMSAPTVNWLISISSLKVKSRVAAGLSHFGIASREILTTRDCVLMALMVPVTIALCAELGSADPNQPVQDQYKGTWSMWQVTEDHYAVAEFLADKVTDHIESTNVN